VAETPELGQGDTTESPKPTPKAKTTSVSAQDTMAPAATAPHETPEMLGSSILERAAIVSIMMSPPRMRQFSVFSAALIGRDAIGSMAGTTFFFMLRSAAEMLLGGPRSFRVGRG
jgi:hypothetical protein